LVRILPDCPSATMRRLPRPWPRINS